MVGRLASRPYNDSRPYNGRPGLPPLKRRFQAVGISVAEHQEPGRTVLVVAAKAKRRPNPRGLWPLILN